MGLFDKYILKRAAEIEAKKAEALALDNEIRAREAQRRSDLIRSAREQIKAVLDIEIKKFSETPCDIEAGDRVVLNYYSFGKDGYNGWDAGPNSILNNLRDVNGPVTATVTKVGVAISLVDDLIDKWIDNTDARSFQSTVERGIAGSNFVIETSRRRNNNSKTIFIGNEIGLYWDVFFKLDGHDYFKPVWGLNSKSFLKQGTEEFDKTMRLWTDECQAKSIIRARTEELKQIQDEIKELKAKFPKIR